MIIISDIHGCYHSLLALIARLPADDKIVFGGDLVDRGPRSADVIKYAINNNIPTVLGNHDHMMLDQLTRGVEYTPWTWGMNGGDTTMNSYRGRKSDLDEAVKWLATLPTFILEGDLLVSHTGHANIADPKHDVLDQVWARGMEFPDDGLFRVFGHTSFDEPIITDTYAAIDTGCAYIGKGHLTAFQYPSKRVWTQKNIDTKQPLDIEL